jgi:hypothetical protein
MAGTSPAMTLRVCARSLVHHARACRGHPRLNNIAASKTWMAGTSPAMTLRVCHCLSPVMPSFMPGIHALATFQQVRRGWPGQARPRRVMHRLSPVIARHSGPAEGRPEHMLHAGHPRLYSYSTLKRGWPEQVRPRRVMHCRSMAGTSPAMTSVLLPDLSSCHARLYAGHPRLCNLARSKTWMAGTSRP